MTAMSCPNRRQVLRALGAAGASALLGRSVAACAQAATSHSVLRQVPPNLHAAIRAGSVRADLAPHFDAAARIAVAGGVPLHVPAGTYTMRTWSPPANLTVTTDGRATVFRQLDTGGQSQRFIRVGVNGVRLWPGGSATIDGGMTPRGTNATSFNGGVQVHAGPGARIDRFTCGDIYGRNLGGDVLETGSHRNGLLGHCEIGTIYGDNVYRNIVSITAGRTGRIEGVIQLGGVGLLGLDFEPDPGSGSPIEDWSFGTVRCHRVGFVGDAGVPIGNISGRLLDLDNARFGSSAPPFDYGGLNVRSNPAVFETAIRYRNCRNIVIERAVIRNFPRGAIIDAGETRNDRYTNLLRFDRLELFNNGATTTYEIAQHKTRRLSIGFLQSTSKPSSGTATLIGGTAADTLAEIERSDISGRVIYSHTGRVTLGR